MAQNERQKQLGQFWTPPVIVEFMLELVGFDPLWKVIDPACGEGIFLLKALERGCGVAVGIDIDPNAIERAKELLSAYQSRVKLYCQDGLEAIDDNNAFWRSDYDLVIGNPPFSATGYRVRDPEVLKRFELAKVTVNKDTMEIGGQGRLFELSVERKRQKPSQAIEVLFLERFVQLCKQGGKVCIILPEGVFANSSLRHVREWLTKNFTVHAIIGLPRETFKAVGTTAKTAILFLEKRPPEEGHEVFLAEISQIKVNSGASLNDHDNPQLMALLEAFRERRQEITQKGRTISLGGTKIGRAS